MDGRMNRRNFLKGTGAFSAMAMAVPAIVHGADLPGAGREFTVTILGAGYRGCAALANMRDAAAKIGAKVRLVAVCDYFKDKAQAAYERFGFKDAKVFFGPKSYRDAVEVPADIVISGVPPAFRALHVEAAVKTGHHVFAEKPGCVDGPGARRLIAAAKLAQEKGLSLVAGTQRRHLGGFQSQELALRRGLLGNIIGGEISWCQTEYWCKEQRPGESDADYLIRNWISWSMMSGDHIVEQHVHDIDVACWFMGRYPRTAIGFGGRARRKTGDNYDFFTVDYDFGKNVHIASMCRQMKGSYFKKSELYRTEKYCIFGGTSVRTYDGKQVDLEQIGSGGDHSEQGGNGQINEQSCLLDSILSGKAVNDGERLAMTSTVAVMGRVAAYTGKIIRLSDILSNQSSPYYGNLFPVTAEMYEQDGEIVLPPDNVVAVPGEA